jgi:hypothetical protein
LRARIGADIAWVGDVDKAEQGRVAYSQIDNSVGVEVEYLEPGSFDRLQIEVHQFVEDERQVRSGSLRAGAERFLLRGLAQIGNVHEQKVLGAGAGESRDIRGNGLRGPPRGRRTPSSA